MTTCVHRDGRVVEIDRGQVYRARYTLQALVKLGNATALRECVRLTKILDCIDAGDPELPLDLYDSAGAQSGARR